MITLKFRNAFSELPHACYGNFVEENIIVFNVFEDGEFIFFMLWVFSRCRFHWLHKFCFTWQEKREHPRELNPYLKNNGTGYPEDEDGKKAGGNHLMSSAVIGDGGASWRLKALKRAQEQAARDGRNLEEVKSCIFLDLKFGIFELSPIYAIHLNCIGCGRAVGISGPASGFCGISHSCFISCSPPCHIQ